MPFLRLIRYKNLLMVLLTMVLTKYVLIDALIEATSLSDFNFILLALSIILITAAGYIVNDIYDIKADEINKQHKVFIGVLISKKTAWISYYLFNFIGLVLGGYLSLLFNNLFGFCIFIISPILLFFYSTHMKRLLFVGNIIVSLLIALSVLIIPVFELNSTTIHLKDSFLNSLNLAKPFWIVVSYSFFAFLATLIREIIKDIEDVDGDLKLNAKTLPIVIGRKRASRVAFFFSAILIFFLITIIKTGKNNVVFFSYATVFLLLPLFYFMYKLWFAKSKKDFTLLSNLLKIILFFGILSMIFFNLKLK